MILPNPVLLGELSRERHRELRAAALRRPGPRAGSLRMRVGHALIAAGSALSRERSEQPARPPARARTA
jgi:hypothetical protein